MLTPLLQNFESKIQNMYADKELWLYFDFPNHILNKGLAMVPSVVLLGRP